MPNPTLLINPKCLLWNLSDLRFRLCWLLGSVNGLICLKVKVDRDDVPDICNPITREYIILPGDPCEKSSIIDIVTLGLRIC